MEPARALLVRTRIRYDGAIKAESVDWTHGNGCVDNNLSIAEGKDVNVRVCRINNNWQANSCPLGVGRGLSPR